MRVLSIGEILWDVYPDRELLGGAAFNFATFMHRLGAASALMTGVGDDLRGKNAREAMVQSGLISDAVQTVHGAATGTAEVQLDEHGVPEFKIVRPAAYDRMTLGEEQMRWIAEFKPDWLYVGSLLHMNADVENFTTTVVRRLAGTRCFYDVNLRKHNWNFELVKRLSDIASVVKLNETEAEQLFEAHGRRGVFSLQSFCRDWAGEHVIDVICVTMGERGCAVYVDGSLQRFPGYEVEVVDTVGSGDAFAAGFLFGYQQGWEWSRTARLANALGAVVASHPGAVPNIDVNQCIEQASAQG